MINLFISALWIVVPYSVGLIKYKETITLTRVFKLLILSQELLWALSVTDSFHCHKSSARQVDPREKRRELRHRVFKTFAHGAH